MSGGKIGSQDGVEDNRRYLSHQSESICAVSWNQGQRDIIAHSPNLESLCQGWLWSAWFWSHPFSSMRNMRRTRRRVISKKNIAFSSLRPKSLNLCGWFVAFALIG